LQDYKFNFKNGCLVAEIRPKWTNKAILFKFLKLCCLSKESKKRALSSHLRRHLLRTWQNIICWDSRCCVL